MLSYAWAVCRHTMTLHSELWTLSGSNWTEKRREPTLGSVAMLCSSKHRHVGDRGLGPARPFYTWLHGNIKRVWNGTFSMRDALDPRLEEEKKKRKCC